LAQKTIISKFWYFIAGVLNGDFMKKNKVAGRKSLFKDDYDCFVGFGNYKFETHAFNTGIRVAAIFNGQFDGVYFKAHKTQVNPL
jgi:hypothetical protein